MIIGDYNIITTPKPVVASQKKTNPTFCGHTIAEEFAKDGIYYLAHQTSFFREPATLEFVKKYIIKNFADQNDVKILVGACSTGEEAITLSMLLNEIANKTKITAFDISKMAIQAAKRQVYFIQKTESDIHNSIYLKDIFLAFPTTKPLDEFQQKYKKLFDEFFTRIKNPIRCIFYDLFHDYYNVNHIVMKKNRYFRLNADKALNCDFKVGDIRELNKVTDEKFDVRFFRNALYHMVRPKMEATKKEIILSGIIENVKQALKPNGIFVLSGYEHIQINDDKIIPKVMKKYGFTPVYSLSGNHIVWKNAPN